MAEKAIQTFKDHFVGVLNGCAPTFPLHLWCQLLPQVERQLLLLQQSWLHPNLLAYPHVYGHHDYNRHLFIPIGIEALVHDKPHKCHTYAKHCKKAFVLGNLRTTIHVGNSGQQQHVLLGFWVRHFSNTRNSPTRQQPPNIWSSPRLPT